MTPPPDFDTLLRPVREAARELPRESLPGLLGALAALQGEILLRPASEPHPKENGDRGLSPAEAARILGRSADWIYRHRHELPTTRLSSGRWVISEARLRRWLDARSK
jgi:hypothetical protein